MSRASCKRPVAEALLVAFAFLAVGAASSTHADSSTEWERRPFAIAAHLGAGTPVGFVGLTADYTLLPRLSPTIGFGLGSGRTGGSLHLAAGAMLRVFEREHAALYIGADYSTGGWADLMTVGRSDPSDIEDTTIFSDRMHWLHGSLGADIRRANGFVFRAYLGLAAMLNPDSRRCVDELTGDACLLQERDFGASELAFIGFALGFAE